MANSEVSRIQLKARDRLNIFTDLSTMLTAGIPILEALDSLSSDSKGNVKKALSFIQKSLNNGTTLSAAMEKMPNAFDPVSVNLVRSAEIGGTLETTLRDIVVSTKKEMEFNDQIRNTMIYPLFVMAVFLGVVILMLTFVIPRVAEVFSTMNVRIPYITHVMFKASKLFTSYWALIFLAVTLLVCLIIVFVKTNRHLIARVVLSLPMLRRLGINIDLARFTRSFGLLMRSGVPILEALSLSEHVVQKKSIITIIQQMKVDVTAGKPLTASMRKSNDVIPAVMWRSLKTAESSGAIDQTLQNLTEHFDEQVSGSLKVLSSLFEPLLIVIVGVMVGILMISIIAPIYNMISQINNSAG